MFAILTRHKGTEGPPVRLTNEMIIATVWSPGPPPSTVPDSNNILISANGILANHLAFTKPTLLNLEFI